MFADHTLGSYGLLSKALGNVKFQLTDMTYSKPAPGKIIIILYTYNFEQSAFCRIYPSLDSHASVDQMHYRVSQRAAFYGRKGEAVLLLL